MGKSRTSKFYATHPESRAKRNAAQAKINKTEKETKRRTELNKLNKKHGSKKGDGLDYDHAKGKLVKESVNRGRNSKNGGTAGDKRARG